MLLACELVGNYYFHGMLDWESLATFYVDRFRNSEIYLVYFHVYLSTSCYECVNTRVITPVILWSCYTYSITRVIIPVILWSCYTYSITRVIMYQHMLCCFRTLQCMENNQKFSLFLPWYLSACKSIIVLHVAMSVGSALYGVYIIYGESMHE